MSRKVVDGAAGHLPPGGPPPFRDLRADPARFSLHSRKGIVMTTAPQHAPSPSAPRSGSNRRTGKAVLAGAVAVGLLAAGGGTFSKWYDDQAVASDQAVSTGELQLGTPTALTWSDGADRPIDLAGFQAVPGDTVRFRTTTTVQAEGQNLKGTLALQLPAGIQQLVQAGYVVPQVQMSGLQDRDADEDGVYTVTGDVDDHQEVAVTASFTWTADSVEGQDGQNTGSLSLQGTKLVLQQVV